MPCASVKAVQVKIGSISSDTSTSTLLRSVGQNGHFANGMEDLRGPDSRICRRELPVHEINEVLYGDGTSVGRPCTIADNRRVDLEIQFRSIVDAPRSREHTL